tara:strand:- start:1073 stop:1723 length:651 start_codon:yes stop_codon:yes gene_type:complete
MYKPPQDIITDLLQEDIGINLKQRMKTIGVNINEPTSVDVNSQISVNIVNPNERKHKFSVNMREALNGDLMFMDHKDIDIILMKEKKKIVAFPKDLMSEVVYGAESRLMEHLRKKGIIQFDSIQGGNVYGSLEGKILESKENDEITLSIYELNEWLKSEGNSTARKEKYTQQIKNMELHPDEDLSTELGEVPHAEEKGSINQHNLFAPYLYGKYTY